MDLKQKQKQPFLKNKKQSLLDKPGGENIKQTASTPHFPDIL